jgi:stress response protein YsnF
MITRDQIPAVMKHPVYDVDGNKIGQAQNAYFDDRTGQPEWVGVKTGTFGGHESLVPVRQASFVQDHLEVPYPKDRVTHAPEIGADSSGRLPRAGENRLFEYYGLTPGATGRQAPRPAQDRAQVADRQASPGDAMTRSEERLHVGTERQEVGRARLHKYVVTEEQEQTVPVRHEEAHLEREPITEANRGQALAGPGIAEADHEVVLHADRPVVETRAEPVERVRLVVDEHTEQQKVKGTVRKERIEFEEGKDSGRDTGRGRQGRRGPL